MTTAKIAITMKKDILTRLDLLVKSRIFPNRSKAIQDAARRDGFETRLYNRQEPLTCPIGDPAVVGHYFFHKKYKHNNTAYISHL